MSHPRARSALLPGLVLLLTAAAACDPSNGSKGDDSGGGSGEGAGEGGSGSGGGDGGSPLDGPGYGLAEGTTVLFIVDASASIAEENAALAQAAQALIANMAGQEGVAWRVGVTQSAVDPDSGPTEGIDPGEDGTLAGPVITDATPDPVAVFLRQTLCTAMTWSPSDLPSDPDYTCGDPAPATVSTQYLDCVCGADAWNTRAGSGNEEPLEATRRALCRAVPSPPEACEALDQTQADLLIGGPVLVLSVSDEADNSRLLPAGDADPAPYLAAFSTLVGELRWSGIGPVSNPDGSQPCSSAPVPTWSIDRLVATAEATGGAWLSLYDEPADCALADMDAAIATWWVETN